MRSTFVGLGGWLKNSFIDFPGTVSTVLFFSGCNLRCPYCHNPDLALGKENICELSEEIWSFLEKRKGMIDGVVFSGGEPTIHPGIAQLCREIRDLGYRVKLDSNGLLPAAIRACEPDYLALDIKTIPSRYNRMLGASCLDVAARLGESIDIVRGMHKNAEVRITVAPGLIDRNVVKELAGQLRGVSRVFLQQLNRRAPMLDLSYSTITPVSDGEIEEFRRILAQSVGTCTVR